MDMDLLEAIDQKLVKYLAPIQEQINRLDGQIDGLKEHVMSLEGQIGGMTEQVTGIEGQILGLQDQVTGVNLVLENDIRSSIQTIAEGHVGLSEKLSRIDTIADDIDEIKGAIVAVESVVVKNRSSIIDLQEAKYK